MTEDKMVGWHHQLNGLEFEQAAGVGDGEGSLVCCSPWGPKELAMIEQLSTHTFILYTNRNLCTTKVFDIDLLEPLLGKNVQG